MQSLKFKSGRHLNLNDQILPTKRQLIDYARTNLCLEHTRVTNGSLLGGLPSIKDQLILMIFIFHVVVPSDLVNSEISREKIHAYLQQRYAFVVQSGETEQNLEEILIDLVESEYLVDPEV